MLRELNNEAILLLYLADELPAKDRSEVERMLQTDAGMRNELALLESALASFETGMGELDSDPPANEAANLRRISSAMRQRFVETADAFGNPRKSAAATVTLRYPWWTYPAIAAAAVAIIVVSWWGNRPMDPLKIPADPQSIARTHVPGDSNKSVAVNDEAANIENIDNPTIPPETVASLDAIQDRIAEISRSQPISSFGDDAP